MSQVSEEGQRAKRKDNISRGGVSRPASLLTDRETSEQLTLMSVEFRLKIKIK